MKNSARLSMLACGALVLAGSAFMQPARANPLGVSYIVNVTTSFGTSFTDCFSFSRNGVLTVGGYGPLSFTFQSHGNNKKKVQAVSPLAIAEGNGFTIEFNGATLGHTDGYLFLNGSDEGGDSYVVSGPAGASCTAASRTNGSPYHPAAQ